MERRSIPKAIFEFYPANHPNRQGTSNCGGAREAAYDAADSYRKVLEEATARRNLLSTAPQISEIKGDFGYGPSIRYPEPDTSTPTPSENYDSWINQQYNELLGRDAGTEGLNYWTGDLIRGQTKDQVRDNIMRSDEFKNRLKLVTDYRNEFGTDPDESWLDERVGPGGVWLMEGYGDDVDVSDPETFLRAFGKGGRNRGKIGGRGLGNRTKNKTSNKTSNKTNRRGHNSAGSGMSNKSRNKSKK